MTIYYNKNSDGSVKEWTPIKQNNGFEFETEEEIVMYEGKAYVYSELPNKKKYKEYQNNIIKEYRKEEIISELKKLDEKRIRAICEPSVKDENSGETWLEYYNTQVQELRTELTNLQ